MQAGKIRGIDVVAALVLRPEYELDRPESRLAARAPSSSRRPAIGMSRISSLSPVNGGDPSGSNGSPLAAEGLVGLLELLLRLAALLLGLPLTLARLVAREGSFGLLEPPAHLVLRALVGHHGLPGRFIPVCPQTRTAIVVLPAAAIVATLPLVDEGTDLRRRYEHGLSVVEEMKRELRERAQHVAERERELDELRARLERELARAEPAWPLPGKQELDERERWIEQRERELAQAVAATQRKEQEASTELALAQAERERLDERERDIHKVERELAGLRIQLAHERSLLGIAAEPEPIPPPEPLPEREPPPPTPLPQPAPPGPELEPAAALAGAPLDDTVETPRPARRTKRR